MKSSVGSGLKDWLETMFPERHLFVRSDEGVCGIRLSPVRQFALALLAGFIVIWLALSTGAAMFMIASYGSGAEDRIKMVQARSERWVADRQARLDKAMLHANSSSGSLEELADTIEKRNNALVQVLQEFKGVPGAATALAPQPVDPSLPPLERIYSVRAEQERIVSRAETFARSRAERLRLTFRVAGLNPANYASGGGNSRFEGQDIKELALALGVDVEFATRIYNASSDLADMRGLERSAVRMPFGRPVSGVRETSGYGVRFDPFTRAPRLHQGQDFAGPYLTPIHASAPGIVSFAGTRSGYGRTVEIDHGNGFKTRYAHLASYNVSEGQHVAVGQRIASMGNTGRSTGVHLHYEVWLNGRPQNPARFLKAGQYVQQN